MLTEYGFIVLNDGQIISYIYKVTFLTWNETFQHQTEFEFSIYVCELAVMLLV